MLFDLVPGHTSEEHAWFKASCRPEHNEYSDRFIWTDSCFASGDSLPFIGGETPRNGTYILNFFELPARAELRLRQDQPTWQKPTTDLACLATVEAMKDVMRFWLDMGCDGFRVDMASSLVKNDTKHKRSTPCHLARHSRHAEQGVPQAALVAEWNSPRMSLKNGFDMDFYLEWQGQRLQLADAQLRRCHRPTRTTSAKPTSARTPAPASISFWTTTCPATRPPKKDGLWCFITCNHDTIRPSAGLTVDELRLALRHAVHSARRTVRVLRR